MASRGKLGRKVFLVFKDRQDLQGTREYQESRDHLAHLGLWDCWEKLVKRVLQARWGSQDCQESPGRREPLDLLGTSESRG